MPKPQRDAVRTRALLLTAAGRAIATRGASVSLDVIAREAGVSKGGLLHHFPTREDLLLALMQDLLDQFTAAVDRELERERAALSPSEPAPAGTLVRAYVRAVFADLEDGDRAREQVTLMGMIGSSPAVTEFVRTDDETWAARLASDGLDPLRAAVITNAADGVTGSLLWSRKEPESYRALQETLITLTYNAGPLDVAPSV